MAAFPEDLLVVISWEVVANVELAVKALEYSEILKIAIYD